VALAVTTSLAIKFPRPPLPTRLTCTARLLKLGRRLAVIEASISQNDPDELAAHATATYSIPPRWNVVCQYHKIKLLIFLIFFSACQKTSY
jgi:acyl-coenzyme A thioesterase PaaI-like protein